jgi:hypothetical protein
MEPSILQTTQGCKRPMRKGDFAKSQSLHHCSKHLQQQATQSLKTSEEKAALMEGCGFVSFTTCIRPHEHLRLQLRVEDAVLTRLQGPSRVQAIAFYAALYPHGAWR